MKLYVLHLGNVWCDKGFNFTPGHGDGVMIRVPVPSYLIETDDGELVLVDTGLHAVHIEHPGHTFGKTELSKVIRPEMTDEHRLERQLGRLGRSPADITHVVNTHFHFDHCGQNHLFASVPILVQREHRAYALEHPAFPREYFDLPDLTYTLLDGEGEIFKGVTTFLASGHVPHLMALLVELDETAVLLCGDAIPLEEVISKGLWAGFADPTAAEASGRTLAEIARATGARMIYGHDIGQWHRLTRSPSALA